jgi:glucan phosphoethanolaminetransferase (alkaline phosphatase superfamily)
MLTPAVSDSNGRREHVKSLVSAFREAGFRSYWISNQLPIGMRETEISHYVREADEAVFMNLAMRVMHQQGRYDGNLLAPLSNEYKQQWPAKFKQLKAHASEPITAE